MLNHLLFFAMLFYTYGIGRHCPKYSRSSVWLHVIRMTVFAAEQYSVWGLRSGGLGGHPQKSHGGGGSLWGEECPIGNVSPQEEHQ